MYLDHFGLNESPFRITPHTDFFFGGANRGPTLEALLYAITHDEGIVKVSGEVGSGKTMLCRVLMERLPDQVQTILLANPSLTRDEIIYAIGEELDIKPQSERLSVALLKLQEHLINLYSENQRVVLLIDEAHAMPQETLEQVRLLSNLETSHAKLLQIVMFGQPELDEHLNQPHMRQLKERITHSFRLEPLLRSDIEAYLDFRMRAAGYRGPNVFSPDAVRRIVKASEGLTRRVNILADKSLLAAFADNQHGITGRHVGRAIRDSEFHRPPVSKAKLGLAAGGVAAGLALGLGLHFLLSPPAPPAAPTAAPTGAIGAPAAQPKAIAPLAQAAVTAAPVEPPAAPAAAPMTAVAAVPVAATSNAASAA
ncbi:MAG: AAA family ATPase, partial [Burkholderiales bacterium]|nr:AAA family ATPase [Burkholderiales bacterium]